MRRIWQEEMELRPGHEASVNPRFCEAAVGDGGSVTTFCALTSSLLTTSR